MTRTLQQPRDEAHNIRVYDNDGALLASIHVRPDISLYITHYMLYRYCSIAFHIPNQDEWGIFPLRDSGMPGHLLRDGRETAVRPGNYIVLGRVNRCPVVVQPNLEHEPRRVLTRDRGSEMQSQGQSERSRLQHVFRTNLLTRDGVCAITQNNHKQGGTNTDCLVQASHIIPTSQISTWNRDYREHITDGSPDQIGQSRMYSPRNGLLLGVAEHILFDKYIIGVDPMANYKVICFGNDTNGWGGKRLKESAVYGANSIPGVHPSFLQWHLRMCILANMKANSEPRSPWEDDLGEDDIGQILEQHDASERMETELFTRLGEYVV